VLATLSLFREQFAVAREKGRLLGAESLNAFGWINRPPVEDIARKCRVHAHLPVVLERDPLLIKQRIDVWREKHPVMSAEALAVRRFAPRLDVAGDQ